jgi:hypothetical protein
MMFLTDPADFEADWVQLSGSTFFAPGKKDTISVDWQIISNKPWILTILEIWPDSAGIDTAEFNLPYCKTNDKIQLLWYGHFMDTLNLNGYLTVENGTDLLRKLTAKYVEMPMPFEVTSLLANVEYRTTIVYQDTLGSRKNEQE